jgi:hypothetical protein
VLSLVLREGTPRSQRQPTGVVVYSVPRRLVRVLLKVEPTRSLLIPMCAGREPISTPGSNPGDTSLENAVCACNAGQTGNRQFVKSHCSVS